MAIGKALYSSRSEEWETPAYIFDPLDAEFRFTLDACANADNAKCSAYFTREQDGLLQDWRTWKRGNDGAVWCNPPYGKHIGLWMAKAQETAKGGATVVCLVHARTGTRWFHKYVYEKQGVEMRFIKGRVKFVGATSSAPFPSMIVVYRPVM